MDIQLFGKDSLKIKIKKTTLSVDPKTSIQKFDADAVLLMNENSDVSRINNYRVVVDGPGEYEIGGLKVLGIKTGDNIIYTLSYQNVATIIAKASCLNGTSVDKLGEYPVAIINADSDLNQDVLTAIEPRVIVLYGEKAKEGAKSLGKENISPSSKITVSEEKLPEELDVMLLL